MSEAKIRLRYVILVAGSLLFVASVWNQTRDVPLGGSHPESVTARNTATIIHLLGTFALFAALVVIVLGRAILQMKGGPLKDMAADPLADNTDRDGPR